MFSPRMTGLTTTVSQHLVLEGGGNVRKRTVPAVLENLKKEVDGDDRKTGEVEVTKTK